MNDDDLLICAHCGDRIGVYEPLWRRHPDGTFERTSFLIMQQRQPQDPTRSPVWHINCLETDDTTPPG